MEPAMQSMLGTPKGPVEAVHAISPSKLQLLPLFQASRKDSRGLQRAALFVQGTIVGCSSGTRSSDISVAPASLNCDPQKLRSSVSRYGQLGSWADLRWLR